MDATGADAGQRAEQRSGLRAAEAESGTRAPGPVQAQAAEGLDPDRRAGRRSSRPRARSAAAATSPGRRRGAGPQRLGSTSVSSPMAAARAARAAGRPSRSPRTRAAPRGRTRPRSAAAGARRGPGLEGPREEGGGPRPLAPAPQRLEGRRSARASASESRSSPSGSPAGARRQQRGPGAIPVEPVAPGQRVRLLGDLAGELGRPRRRLGGERELPEHRRDLVGGAVRRRRGAGRSDAGDRDVALAPRRGAARDPGAEPVHHVRPRAGRHRPAGLGLQRRHRVPVAQPRVRHQPPPQDQQPGRGRHPERGRHLEHGLGLLEAGAVPARVREQERPVAPPEGLHHRGLLDLDRLEAREAVVHARGRLGEPALRVVEVVAAHHLRAGRQERELAAPGRRERLVHQRLGLGRWQPMAWATATIIRTRPAAGPAWRRRRGGARPSPPGRGLTPTVSIASCERYSAGGRAVHLARRHEPADRLVPALEGRRRVPGQVREEGVGQLDPGRGRQTSGGMRRARRPASGARAWAPSTRPPPPAPRRRVGVARLQVVAHGLLVLAGRRPGPRGPLVQHRQPVGLPLDQAAAQEGVEEVVVAEPVALRLDDEQVRGEEAADHLRRVGRSVTAAASAGVKRSRTGRVEQEALEVGGQPASTSSAR